MKIVSLTSDNQGEIIAEAIEILKRGGSIVYPTDTVYGLGVNPFDDFAVRRLFRIKKRPSDKPVALIVKSIAMAKKLAYIDAGKEKILRSVWPGAVSVVLYKRRIISREISSGTDTVSLRIPDNEFCIALIRAFNGPVTSTSANISGENHTNDAAVIAKRFAKEIYKPDLIIDAGVLLAKKPSTVLDLSSKKPKITRIGPVSPKELTRILRM
jgi:L-threonylcarbamoyladenylate synthase